jgi:hypothetical protein
MEPERALRVLTQQLESLEKLRNRNYQDAHQDETEWQHVTQGIIEAAFGDPSTALHGFHGARWAGEHYAGGMDPRLHQSNFEARIQAFEALLRSQISLIRLQLPEDKINATYGPGEQYDFYRDLSTLMETATREIFIIDAYLDEKLFNLYVDKVPPSTKVRVLSSNRVNSNVVTVANMYAKSRSLELRSSPAIHDRAVFFDDRGCVIGQSIKDAAGGTKPTYLIELEEPALSAIRDSHNTIWSAAPVVV